MRVHFKMRHPLYGGWRNVSSYLPEANAASAMCVSSWSTVVRYSYNRNSVIIKIIHNFAIR